MCIEDLHVRNMSASVAGTTEASGTNVRAKSGLNRAISRRARAGVQGISGCLLELKTNTRFTGLSLLAYATPAGVKVSVPG